MKSSKNVVKLLEITTRKPCPDRLVEYHIKPLAGNKKTADLRPPMANADILSNPEHLLRNPDLFLFDQVLGESRATHLSLNAAEGSTAAKSMI